VIRMSLLNDDVPREEVEEPSGRKKLRLVIPLVLLVVVVAALNFIPRRTAQTYVKSVQVYWRADQAMLTMTTTEVTHEQSWLMTGLGWLGKQVGMLLGGGKMEAKPGAAHVYRWTGKTWDHQTIPASAAPHILVMWPYGGKFYTWDDAKVVQTWNGRALEPTKPERAAELRASFPNNPNNYLAAGKASHQPYSIVQDVITRDEWHAYMGVTAMANGAKLSFPAGENTFELQVQRAVSQDGESPAELTIMLKGPGLDLKLWPQQ